MAKLNSIAPVLTPQTIERFLSKVNREPGQGPNGDCWEWTGSFFLRKGYGQFSVTHSRGCSAHRIAFLIEYGYWPAQYVCHRCDNVRCVRPDHLFEGTPLDNMQDKIAKGRARAAHGKANGAYTHPEAIPRGEKHPYAKLTELQVREIRALYKPRTMSYTMLGTLYGVDRMLIFYIVKRKIWKHVL